MLLQQYPSTDLLDSKTCSCVRRQNEESWKSYVTSVHLTVEVTVWGMEERSLGGFSGSPAGAKSSWTRLTKGTQEEASLICSKLKPLVRPIPACAGERLWVREMTSLEASAGTWSVLILFLLWTQSPGSTNLNHCAAR